MRERVELLKGSLEFLTPPGRGTLVRLRVPLGTPATI
jgi:signal transduction histidine kinase